MAKPASKIDWTEGNATPGVVRIEPTGSKKTEGWNIDERPAREFMNWLFYNIYLWIVYFETATDATLTSNQTQVVTGAITASKSNVLANPVGGDFVVTLPSAAANPGYKTTVKNIDSTNNITIAVQTGDKLESVTNGTVVIPAGESMSFASDSVNGFWQL